MALYQICLILPGEINTPWDSFYYQNEESVITAIFELRKQHPAKQFTYKTLHPAKSFERQAQSKFDFYFQGVRENNLALGEK